MSTTFIQEAKKATCELIEAAKLKEGDLLVVGCSSSEILGQKIGTHSAEEVGEAVYCAIREVCVDKGIALAAQCCEHLNRALVLERSVAEKRGYEIVNAQPFPKAGGSFATAAWKHLDCPATVEHIKADAGMDIGGTLIGMHLREVAVPTRLSLDRIGSALLLAARTRPKFIGGERAHYCEDLK